MRRHSPRPLLRAALLLMPAACLIALTWFLALNAQPSPAAAQDNVAAQVQRQVAALDNRLAEMVRAWRQDPQHFSVASWNTLLGAADGVRPDVTLTSPKGVVIDTSTPGMTGIDVHEQDWFRSAQDRASRGDTAAITMVRVDEALHDWHIRVARWLQGPDRQFAGVLLADAALDPLNALFRHAASPSAAAMPLIGTPTALQLLAGMLSLSILAFAGLLLVRSGASRRQDTGLALDRRQLAIANEELLAAGARANAMAGQLHAILSGMSDGVALLDPQLRLLEWNQHFAELAGVPERLLQSGTPMEDILRAQAEAGEFGQVPAAAEVARRLSVLRNLQAGQSAERTRSDGRVIELRRIPLPDGSSVTLYRDATTRRQAETSMREARATAEAAAGAKSRFVALVSHEIRSPLIDLLATLRLLGGSLPAGQQSLLGRALQSGEALCGRIDDILEMSSMEAGQVVLRPGACKPAPLLESVVDMFQAQAAERGITLRLATDPNLPAEIDADSRRLRQVLVNLLSNAVKWGIPGPVALLTRQDTDAQGRAVLQLAVRDRGPVMEEAGRARLFRPFSRLDLTGGEPFGSGIGLAICRYLVTLMGGEIGCRTWVAEDRHTGNEYWVQVPLVPVPAAARAVVADDDQPQELLLPRTRILLVEKDGPGQLVTAMLLRRAGHSVDVAGSGEAALRALSRQPYDLVFADLHLAGMSGLDLARALRTLPGAAGAVPVVALSANTGPHDRLDCEQAGIGGLLDKPVALAELLAAIQRHVWRGRPARGASLDAPHALAAPPLLAEDRIGELRAHLPPDALRDMVQDCLMDMHARLPALRRAVQTGAGAEAAAQAHAMIGMAAGYGMAALEMRLRALAAAARGPHDAAAAELLEQIETELAQSTQALREALRIELV